MAVSQRIERYELVVIGGGQAGLAAGYWLAQHDIDFLIVDAYPRVPAFAPQLDPAIV